MSDSIVLKSLCEQLVKNVVSKDRTYRLSTYNNCFVGAEAVTYMVEAGMAATREEAVELGHAMEELGMLTHVTRDHPFLDSPYFYRFSALEPSRGFNESETWSNDNVNEFKNLSDGFIAPHEVGERKMDLEVSPLDEYNKTLLNLVKPKTWVNPTSVNTFSLLVIGAGAGGLISAIQGAGLNIKTALIEKHLLGGDCLNVGCVPSKALIRCARSIHEIKHANEFGVSVGEVKIDFGEIMKRMRRLRAHIAPADSADRYAKLGVHVFQGTASFVDKSSVEVTDSKGMKQILSFSKCIVATGGRAFVPPIEGLKDVSYLTNASLFNLTKLPAKFGVIGSGPIGTEMAQSFASFGSEVFVFDAQQKILPREDVEAAAIIQAAMENDGVKFFLGSQILRVYNEKVGEGNKICIEFKYQESIETIKLDELLVSAGRAPNVEGLDLEKAGVKYTRKGITVTDGLQTTNSNIYAVGDVCLSYQFTHVADASAKVAFRNAMFPARNEKMSKRIVPWCTYTSPEIAHVGFYEGELDKKGEKYDVFKTELEHNDRAILEGGMSDKGFIKLIIKKGTDKILGCTIVSDNAGDMISEVTACMVGNVGALTLSGVIHPYPTTADAIRICAGQMNKTRLTPFTKGLLKRLSALKTSFA